MRRYEVGYTRNDRPLTYYIIILLTYILQVDEGVLVTGYFLHRKRNDDAAT